MKLMNEVWRALTDAGVQMTPLDARHVLLRHGHRSARLLLRAYSRALNPSDVDTVVKRHDEPGLLVVPRATAEVRRAAERAGWSWLVAGPGGVHGNLRLGDADVTIGGHEAESRLRERGKPGRVPWRSLAVVRRLIEQPAVTQNVLATLAHVSQPRVSQILNALADRHLVERVDAGWVVRDFDGLLHLWLETYPGPGGIRTYWFGLDAPRRQAQEVMRLLSKHGRAMIESAGELKTSEGEPFAVLSGDVAADLIAPWRSPSRAVIYAHAGADLADVGLTPVGAEEATLELIVPQDSGVWPVASSRPSGGKPASHGESAGHSDPLMPIADPLQVLWDVQRSPGSDSSEAVARLWEVLRERSRVIGMTGVS